MQAKKAGSSEGGVTNIIECGVRSSEKSEGEMSNKPGCQTVRVNLENGVLITGCAVGTKLQ